MENSGKTARTRKPLSYILAFGIIILFNCFGFPVYNLNKAWPLSIQAEYVFMGASCAVFSGGMLAGLFPKRRCRFIALLTAALACGGLACRFLLEFGEASNTYNFTFPNILLHLGTVTALSSLSWLYAARREGARG